MNDDEIQSLQEELTTAKLELEQAKADHVGLRNENADLKRKVDAQRSAAGVQERHHKMYHGQFREARDKCRIGQQKLVQINALLSREEPDIKDALKLVEEAHNDLNTAIITRGPRR